jgi:hypothetical protein
LTNRRGTFVEILDVDAYPELVYDDGFYIVQAKIEIDDEISTRYFIISEELKENIGKKPVGIKINDFKYHVIADLPEFKK